VYEREHALPILYRGGCIGANGGFHVSLGRRPRNYAQTEAALKARFMFNLRASASSADQSSKP
jgi:hypothetical protein